MKNDVFVIIIVSDVYLFVFLWVFSFVIGVGDVFNPILGLHYCYFLSSHPATVYQPEFSGVFMATEAIKRREVQK
ncbi:UNVERIFIED_ORG: hypothetical protein EOZ59_4039 [Serratia quinivorans]|jgi:hypothetical protein|nr:Uncharacterised protein [Serratia grimesii]